MSHIKYFYDGKYPRDKLRKSLMNGITVTEEFVKILEHETKRAS